MKIDVLELAAELVPIVAVGCGDLVPTQVTEAVHKAVHNVEAMRGLDGAEKRAKAVELVQADVKDLLDDFLPGWLVNLLVEAAVAGMKIKALGRN